MSKNKLIPFLLSITCFYFCSVKNVAAVEYVNGKYQWQFLTNKPWPQGYQQSTGKPDDLMYARDDYPKDFFKRIQNALPESHVNEAFMTDSEGATIHLTERAEVFITFIHEGAGYKNSFGFFTFDRENPPKSIEDVRETIVFPNLSYPHLTNGHRVSIGTFPAGTSIGFFIAANGYWYWTGVKDFQAPYYYSLSHLNPEQEPELKQHMVLLYDEEVQEAVLGFEDLPRTWGDNDFNDAVFSVRSTPSTAIETQQLVKMPDASDSDADGIDDGQDEYPEDFRRASTSYYPSSTSFVTLAYEDNWPKLGDYDMNDLVIREQLQLTYNADNKITGFILKGFIDARGGDHANGFGLRILNSSPEWLESASISIDGTTYNKKAERWQDDLVIQLWRNSKVFTETGATGKCSLFNTVPTCDTFEPIEFTLDVRLSVDLNVLHHSDFDFFIFRNNNRGLEVHFANYPPTKLANMHYFNRHADNSDSSQGRYYVSDKNLPWALKLNSTWSHPREYIDVLWAYPAYEKWTESSGKEEALWYQTIVRPHHVFQK
ncbi:LruC domain-containing protein [Alteromonas sp. D210916BOD_24]|uniref:LruC domain-containing protein n=1 Tax=Alteromonas sp. D210916BOD_24 TaxID=3157618 RepID=UPI00399C4E35